MITVFESMLPIFLLIALGFIVRKSQIISEDHWSSIGTLAFYLFFPSLLAQVLIQADLNGNAVQNLALTMFLSVFTLSVICIAIMPILRKTNDTSRASLSTIFQTATRWNGFTALAIINNIYGSNAISLTAIVFAAMAPFLNLLHIGQLTILGSANAPSIGAVAKRIILNPLIIACIFGLTVNFANVTVYEPFMVTLDLLGRCALGVGLVLVGAGLRIQSLAHPSFEAVIGVVLKLIAMPALVALLGLYFELDPQTFVIAIICAAVPTAMNGYVLARQMGGDAPLYATTVTLQTLLSFITIPLLIWLAQIIVSP